MKSLSVTIQMKTIEQYFLVTTYYVLHPVYHIELFRSIEFGHRTKSNSQKKCKSNKSDVRFSSSIERLNSVIERSGTQKRKTRIEHSRTFDFRTLDGQYVNGSSVKTVKAL